VSSGKFSIFLYKDICTNKFIRAIPTDLIPCRLFRIQSTNSFDKSTQNIFLSKWPETIKNEKVYKRIKKDLNLAFFKGHI